jgi:hypothetical protein
MNYWILFSSELHLYLKLLLISKVRPEEESAGGANPPRAQGDLH